MLQIKIGEYNTLTINRKTKIGVYLDDGAEGILLPTRFVPREAKPGDEIDVFLYHDSENRIIATTQKPKAIVGDIVFLTCISVTPLGAFLDWGLMKDLFVAKSQQITSMRVGGKYLVRIYIDKQTGRVAATEKIEASLNDDCGDLKEMQTVNLIVYRRTEIGYSVIINNLYKGLLHFNDVFTDLQPGEKMEGYIKKIRADKKIDVMPGKPGFKKVDSEAEKILTLLKENNGFLPYHDKSDPGDIYAFFGISKKVFKMTIGNLYKQHFIELTKAGIKLL